MIKLGKLTDYAIAVMGQLAQEGTTSSHSAHHLSDKTGIPEPTVAKVLKLLSKGNLVTSERGAAGGYKLVKGAEKTSIAEIITTMDGPISIVSCVDEESAPCDMAETCPTKGNWKRVNDAIRSALEGVMLSEMLSTNTCSRVHDFTKDVDVNCA